MRNGPASLDASRLPRRLRPIVLRGLSTAPADRWPDVPALLAVLERRRQPRWVLPALAGAALFVGSIALATRGHGNHGPDLSKIVRLSDGTVHAPADSVHALARELHARTSARLVPTVRQGKPVGLKVFSLHPGTLLDAIGISNGDIITAVDGQPTLDLLALYSAVHQDANEITLTVESAAGAVRTIHVAPR